MTFFRGGWAPRVDADSKISSARWRGCSEWLRGEKRRPGEVSQALLTPFDARFRSEIGDFASKSGSGGGRVAIRSTEADQSCHAGEPRV